jgi:hypothetical protein
MPAVVNGITYVVSEHVEKQRPIKRSWRITGKYFKRVMKESQKYGPGIFCWLGNYEISLHHH